MTIRGNVSGNVIITGGVIRHEQPIWSGIRPKDRNKGKSALFVRWLTTLKACQPDFPVAFVPVSSRSLRC